MATQKTREEAPEIKIGSIITFTNRVNYSVKITVSRVENKSWYDQRGSRNSYGTLISYMNEYSDFQIH